MRLSLVSGAIAAFVVATLVGQGTVPPPTVPPPAPPTTTPVGSGRATPPRAPASGTIAPKPAVPVTVVIGQVVDNAGRVVPAVVVRLIGQNSVDAVVSDPKGRFFFRDIPPGEFVVTATKYGFHDGGYGKRRAGGDPVPFWLNAGQVISDMRIELFRAAVITGLIVDELNEPVIGARVVAMRRQFVGGEWQHLVAGTDMTDDEGRYRLYGLQPGEYIVSTPTTQVTTKSGILDDTASPAPPPIGGRDLAYATQFYPASRQLRLALPVHLAAGDVRHAVDFQWAAVPARRVSGRLLGPSGSTADQLLRLVPVDSRGPGAGNEAAITISAGDGTFTFARVPSGEYRLEAGNGVGAASSSLLELPAAQPSMPAIFWGRLDVAVNDDDLSDLTVTMRPGTTVSGSIAIEGTEAGSATPPFVRIPITIEPARSGLSPSATPRIDEGGLFSATNLIPGEYFLRVGGLPAGWFLKSITAGGEDALDRPMNVLAGEVADVRIALTNRSTDITGVVRDARLQPAPGAAVIVLPARDTAWSPNRTRQTRASTSGEFAVTGLPPGDYLVVAIDDAAAEGWQDARILATLRTLATRIALREAENRVVQLRLSPLRR